MAPDEKALAVSDYVERIVGFGESCSAPRCHHDSTERIKKAFDLLPDEVTNQFLSGEIRLTVIVEPEPFIPMGMKIRADGPLELRRFTVAVFQGQLEWPEDVFIASFLREIAQAAAGRPPEEEWPTKRGERSRFREMLENQADLMLWKWGLREQDIRFLTATYPPHRVDEIVEAIDEMLRAEQAQ